MKLALAALFVLALATPAMLALAAPPPAPGEAGRRAQPVPIPGGNQIPGGPFIHVFIPGPEPNFMGLHVDPSVITHFRGFSALAYVGGTAVDRRGTSYRLEGDMRVYQGDFLAADGSHHHGTFGFV